jgi:hypothetical protein
MYAFLKVANKNERKTDVISFGQRISHHDRENTGVSNDLLPKQKATKHELGWE